MTHYCPGCGQHGISGARLSCPCCWFRLPASLRAEIWAAYKEQALGQRHRDAIQAACDWYAANELPEPQPH